MGIVPKFKASDLDKIFKEAEKQMFEKVIRVLKYAGEIAINEAKNNGAYQDQTANLRNSIGYVITVNGKVINENFSLSAQGTEPSKENGLKIGRQLALSIARQSKEISLVIVAGMKYAAYVESRGYNVLTSAEQRANQLVPELLRQLKV